MSTSNHIWEASGPGGVPPSGRTLGAVFVRPLWVALTFIAAFAALAVWIRGGGQPPGDVAGLAEVHRHSTRLLALLARWITHLGDVATVGGLTLSLGGFLAWRGRRRDALRLVSSVVGAGITAAVIKQLVERQRPHLFPWLISEGGYSFPSGHSTGSMALALALAVAAWNARPGKAIAAVAVASAAVVGLSRLELGVHYPSDVAAGWLVAGAVVLTATWLDRRLVFGRSDAVCEDETRGRAAQRTATE